MDDDEERIILNYIRQSLSNFRRLNIRSQKLVVLVSPIMKNIIYGFSRFMEDEPDKILGVEIVVVYGCGPQILSVVTRDNVDNEKYKYETMFRYICQT